MTQRKIQMTWVAALALAFGMAGCGAESQTAETESAETTPAAQERTAAKPAPQKAEEPPVCGNCGTIAAIQERKTEGSNKSKGAIAGGVAGAIAGVVVGNQIGSGSGKDLAKVVGGLGGAAAGHQIGKRMDTDTYYAVTVSMEAGGSRTVNVASASALSVGQQVKVNGNNIVLR